MILGIGNDIVEVDRIRAILEKHGKRFLDRLYTPREQEYCLKHKDPAIHFAGRFAAKEALAKALGTGLGRELVTWVDLEIINDAYGKPLVKMSDQLSDAFNSPTLFISISHCDQYATAFAIWTSVVI